jgi:YVTN family beta-propeller protein
VNGYNNSLTATVPLGQNAYYNVVNPVTNTVYVAGNSSSLITIGNIVAATGVTTVTSPSITIHAGSRILVMASPFGSVSPISSVGVVDSNGDTYSPATSLYNSPEFAGEYAQIQIFSTLTPLSNTTSLTVTVTSSSSAFMNIIVLEVVGPYFIIVSGSGNSSSSSSSVSTSVTATSNSLVVGGLSVVTNGVAIPNPNGFTASSGSVLYQENTGVNFGGLFALENSSYASGSITLSGTINASPVAWAAIAIALEPTTYVAAVNGTYNTLVASIPTTAAYSDSLAVNTNTNTLFVAGGTISVVNCFTNTTIASIPVSSPNALVVNPSTNLLYASTSTGMYIINGSNYQIVDTIPTSLTTINQFDLNTALNTVYYQNGSSFSILNGYTNANVATVTNSNTGTYYITSNSSDPTFDIYNSLNTTSFQVHGINGNFNGGGINSAAGNAFYPTSTNSMSLGAPYNLWTNIYTNNLSATGTLSANSLVVNDLTVQTASGTAMFQVLTNTGSTGTVSVGGPITYTSNLQSNLTSIPDILNMSNISTGSVYVDSQAGLHYTYPPVILSTTGSATTPTGGFVQTLSYVYLANNNTNSVTYFNTTTNLPVANLSSGFSFNSPQGISSNVFTNFVYVCNYGNATVTVINAATNLNSFVTTIGVGTNPIGSAVNPFTNTLYVTNYGSGNVSVINGATNTVSATVSVQTNPKGIAVNPVTNTVYVTNYGSSSVSVINGVTNAVTATISVGTDPFGVAVDPNTNTIYVTNTNGITVINGFTNGIITTTTVVSNPTAISVNPYTKILWVLNGLNSTQNTIYAINAQNYSQIGFINNITGGVITNQIAVNTTLNTTYYQLNTTNMDIINGYTFGLTSINILTSAVNVTFYAHYYDPTFGVYNSNNTSDFQVHPINGNFNGGGINSAAGNALYPIYNNSMSLGSPAGYWTTVYATNGTINTSSQKYKNNIKEIDKKKALEFTRNLKPVTWNWNHLSEELNKIPNAGFVIEDVRKVHPEFEGLHGEDGIKYSDFNSYFAGAIQVLADKLDEANETIKKLENRITELEG